MSADDLQSRAADLVRKIITAGIGAIFLTEESLRTLVTEFKLPKELLTGMLESASKTKNDFLQNLSKEAVAKMSDKLNPSELLQELVNNNEIELEIKMRFSPKKKSKT